MCNIAKTLLSAAAVSLLLPSVALASPPELSELEAIRQQMREQQQRMETHEAKIAQQQAEIARLRQMNDNEEHWLTEARATEVRSLITDVLADADVRASLLNDNITAGWNRGFFMQSADGNFRLNIGGWIQPRYEYRRVSDGEDTSSFLMRRVRLDIKGHVISPELTYRIMSEHARSSTLRDAWVNYAFDPRLQVRVGQFTVPFQWHRDVGPRRQHFAERGVPSETFGFPTGRDIGVMLHGTGDDRRWGYGVGFFDGAGRNVATSNSDGHMVSGRLKLAILGELPREESDFARSEDPNLAVGIGGQGAWRNEVRAWDIGRSMAGDERADWIAGTADVRFAWKGFSVAAEGYLRHVDPDDSAVDSYDGWAWMVSTGYMIMPERYEVVARYSQLRLDADDRATREREWGAGLNIYHKGHDWKTRVNLLRHDFEDRHEIVFLIEHHLQF